jgi:hypothetical protein
LFSDEYANISGINYDPNWNQNTIVSQVQIESNTTLKYENLNYQGTDFDANHQDVSGMESLHIDFWTADATALSLYLISPGPVETEFELAITTGEWVSEDIPLTAFTTVDLTDAFQIKIEGNGTIFIDNVYFKAIGSSIDSDEDGVVDILDACPDSSALMSVDENGCELNLAPEVNVSVVQAGNAVSEISTELGLVELTATVADGNTNDSHTFQWSTSGDITFTTTGNKASFDPANLSSGTMSITLEVVDDGSPNLSVEEVIALTIEAPTQTSTSSSAGSGSVWVIFAGLFLLVMGRKKRNC